MNNRQRPDAGRRVYRPDDLVNGRFATRMSGPVARQIALALKCYRLSGTVRAVPQAGGHPGAPGIGSRVHRRNLRQAAMKSLAMWTKFGRATPAASATAA